MNTVFINGNGFDLNLKMKTSYGQFYKFYKNVETNNPSVIQLKKNIEIDIENWADLELALGEYTQKLDSIDEFIKVYEHIGDQCDCKYSADQHFSLPFGIGYQY